MPWLVAVLVGLLGKALESLVGRVLLALGVGMVTATGVDLALSGLKAQTVTAITGIPAAYSQLLGLAKIDICVSMLIGAVISAFGVKYVSGAISRFTAKATWA